VIYGRVSSKEQEKEGFSIPAQLKLLKECAAASFLGQKGAKYIVHPFIYAAALRGADRQRVLLASFMA
jgi:hypothetical protein